MRYIFALFFALVCFFGILTTVEAVSINSNFLPIVNNSQSTTTLTSQICFGTTLSSGSEIIKVWASSDSGGKNIISNIANLTLSSGASYPSSCRTPNSKNESPLANQIAFTTQTGVFSLIVNNSFLTNICQKYYLNFDSNRQGKQNGFYLIELAQNKTCTSSPNPTTVPTNTPQSPQGACHQACRDTDRRCNEGLYCLTDSTGKSGCYNDTNCPSNNGFPSLPRCPLSPTPIIEPTNTPLIPPSIIPEPSTVISTATPTVSSIPTISQTPTPTPFARCNESCASTLPACDDGYYCYQTESNKQGICKNYTDCKPDIACIPTITSITTPSAPPTSTPSTQLSCSSCQTNGNKFMCEKNKTDTPPSMYCSSSDETILTPENTISCQNCTTQTRSCPFFAQAQLLVKHSLSNSNQVYLPLNINQKDISWYAMNDRQFAKNPLYSPKDATNGTDNPFGFTLGKISANIENLTFPLPSNESNPIFRYNNFADKATVKLFFPREEFEIVGQFCQNLGSTQSCPSNLINKQTTIATDTFSPLLLDCNTNIRYGWIMQKKSITQKDPIDAKASAIVPATPPNFTIPLTEQIEGFATGTFGGETPNAKQYFVTDFSDDPKNPQPGTLRHALIDPSPKKVKFSQSGIIELKADISLTSNTTIDGSDRDVVITQKGFRFKNIENIIINKLTMRDCKSGNGSSGDAISIGGSKKIFLHRLSLSNYCDGLVDIFDGSTDVTLSWSHLSKHTKAILISNDNTTPELDKNIRVTLHHNYFQNLDQRIPRVRFGRVDMYNNYIQNWGHYAIGSTYDSQILVERNFFEDFDAKKASLISYTLNEVPGEEGKFFMGFVKMLENAINPNDFTSKERLPQNVFLRPYKATISDTSPTLLEIIKTYSGAK